MKYILLVVAFLFSSSAFAQLGKDGARFITATNQRVNEYSALTVNAGAGATSITVTNNNFNGNGRFTAPLSGGDLILIIQMQGATIRGSLSGSIAMPLDSSWGEILNYNNCGLYEFVQVKSVSGTSVINIDCPLKNSYTVAGKVQVVRVPRYLSLTINADITADAWNGGVGGIVAVEVKGNTVINSGGKIDVTAKGFRGGNLDDNSGLGVNNVGSIIDTLGAEKGEGIAGYQNDYTVYGGKYCKGAAANGGGGGNAHNAGGGGGANGGNPAVWSGHGNPDVTNPSWAAAWNLEFAGFSTHVSSGGGQGGYTFSSDNLDALSVGPNNASWGGDGRNNQGGLGGRPLDYSTGRLFLGGGGGAGDQNNDDGGRGGVGGGMVYIISYGTVSGSGQIISNGSNGTNACCSSTIGITGNDGAGGGGAGGTVVVNSIGVISGISITANGGNGGSQNVSAASIGTINESEGPGGGGGGGYIAVSNAGVTQTANGGANGITDSDGLTEFPPNGATKGGTGMVNQPVANYYITVPARDTICAGVQATITATLQGTVPGGTTVVWYSAPYGGTQLGTGNDLLVGPLAASTTFYVGTCPGTYRDSIKVFVEPNVSINGSPAICKGTSSALNANGAVSYTWFPSPGLSGTVGTTVIVSPTSNSTYTVVGTGVNGCTDTATFSVTVNIPPVLSISNDTIVCRGDSVLITVSGTSSYLWTPSTGLSSTNSASAIAKPTSTTNYQVIGTDINGCIDIENVTVVIQVPFIDAGSNDSVCIGQTATLTASGSTNYLWNTNATTASITVTPAQSTTYTVSTYDGLCSNYDTVLVFVGSYPVADAGPGVTILRGSSIGLNATGGANYQWQPPTGLSCTNCSNPTASPNVTTTYTVTVTNPGGCTDTDTLTVTVDTLAVNCELFVPNFFSPNGDNSNDVLYVRGDCIKSLNFEIYDRWGKKVFETTDITIGWDGKYKGETLANAVFVYQLTVELDSGDKKSLSGNVSLLR